MNNKPILDACCGGKMFYFDKHDPRVLFQDIRDVETTLCDGRHFEVKPDVQADFTNMPYPDNCRAMVHNNKVYILERLPRGRPNKNKYHCRDCAHRKRGYACFSSAHKTMVCTQRPKHNTCGAKGLYYAANEYGTICSKFKPL